MMNMMNAAQINETNGGAKRYYCPWNDYSNTSYWKTYGHAIVCAAKHGLFDIPVELIKAGIRLL